MEQLTVAEFIDPDWGDKVNSGYWVVVPACQATQAVWPIRQPFAGVDFIPQSWIYEFGYCCTIYVLEF